MGDSSAREGKPGSPGFCRVIGGWLITRQIPVAAIAIACAFGAVHGKRAIANRAAFQWEDRVFIQQNSREIHSLADCFTKRPVWPGLYRPLTTNLYYFAARKIFANRIEVHHLINVVFYLANGLVLFLISKRILNYPWALVPPVLLVSRIAHVEIVNNTCEFQSLLSVFLTLLAFHLFTAGRPRAWRMKDVWPLLVFTLALFSKETAVVLPALLMAYRQFFDRDGPRRRYLGPWVVCLAWAVLFALVLRGVSGNTPTGFSYRFSLSSLAGNYAAYLLAFVNLLTRDLPSVVMAPRVAAAAATTAAKLGVSLLLAAALAVLVLQRRFRTIDTVPARVFAFGILFYFAAAAPYVILESRLFMRYAYLGHAGLAISSAALLRVAAEAVRDAVSRWSGTRQA